MLSDFQKGFSAYTRANSVIIKHRLWPFLFVPGMISFGFFVILVILGIFFIPEIAASIAGIGWLSSIGFAAIVAKVLLWVLMLVAGFFTFRYVVLIILAPVLSHLSEVTEKRMLGVELPGLTLGEMIKDVFRALRINVRNLIVELLLTLVINIIPLVNFAAPVLVFFLQSYYTGFGLMDYTLERKNMSPSATQKFVKERKGLATGLGAVFMLLNFVPLIGWIFAPTYGTVAATLASLDELEKSQLPQQQ